MGETLEQYFTGAMQWSYNNGILYITGRDIICIITGLLLGIVLMSIAIVIDDYIERRNKHV